MNARTVLVALLALVCGLSAAVAVNRYQNRPQEVIKPETTQVVVAAVDIGRATTLTKELLVLREWPKDMVPVGAITEIDLAIDRTLKTPLVKGEPVLDGKVVEGRGLEPLIEPGMRAFTILTPTAASGVAGFIMPGNRVDVMLTVNDAQKSTGGATSSTLLQNIEVLAVHDMLDAPASNKVQKMQSITLSCTPENCAKLGLAQTKGTLYLTLRNSKDEGDADTRVITMKELQFIQEPPQEKVEPVVVKRPATPPVQRFEKQVIPAVKIRTLRGRGSGAVVIRPEQVINVPAGPEEAQSLPAG